MSVSNLEQPLLHSSSDELQHAEYPLSTTFSKHSSIHSQSGPSVQHSVVAAAPGASANALASVHSDMSYRQSNNDNFDLNQEQHTGVHVEFDIGSYGVLLKKAPSSQGPGSGPKSRAGMVSSRGTFAFEKVILRDVVGHARPGEVLALMGPSGAGKTTLLELLAGRLSGGIIHGSVRFNGQEQLRKSRSDSQSQSEPLHDTASTSDEISVGFCPQHDTSLIGCLTVMQTMYFATQLQVCGFVTVEEKIRRAEQALRDLNLYHVRESKVGGAFARGLSGGEKRRLTLGTQLVKRPQVLFMDEPTSGLDSFTAYKIMRDVNRLAKRMNTTVICSIHQPNDKILKCFDRLFVLSRGETVFHGALSDCEKLLQTMGYEHPNAAEVLLEISAASASQTDIEPSVFGDFDHDGDDVSEIDEDTAELLHQAERLKAASRQRTASMAVEDSKHGFESHDTSCLQEHATELNMPLPRPHTGRVAAKQTSRLPWKSQYKLLLHRFMLMVKQDPLLFWVRFAMVQFMSLIIGFLYLNMDDSYTAITDTVNVYFFMLLVTTFVSLTALPHSLSDKIVLKHEYSTGMYDLSAYVCANLTSRFIFTTFSVLSFSIVTFFLVGIGRDDGGQFFFFLLALLLANLFAEVFMLVLGAIVRDAIIGIALGVTVYGFFMLMSGSFVSPNRMNPYMRPVSFLSYYKYVIEAMMLNSFPHRTFDCTAIAGKPCSVTGSQVLKDTFHAGNGYFLEDKWNGIGVLAVFFIVTVVIYMLSLVHMFARKKTRVYITRHGRKSIG
jgi:ATP-binding cassette, subfamily G (WHITE), member 2